MNLFENFLKILPNKLYLQFLFHKHHGYFIDFKNPKTYNEKLQWLKIHDHNPLYPELVDKRKVKTYVASILGNDVIIPTLFEYKNVNEINFDELPNSFVIKWNHDSGSIVICKDKKCFDKEAALKKLSRGYRLNGYWYGREWPYKKVQPYLIVEPYLEDYKTGELRDYKFFCFGGVVKCLFIASDRQKAGESVKFDFFDREFNHLDIRNGHPNSKNVIEKPESFEKMISMAEKLSKDLLHARIDFYEVNGKPLFGEITLYHGSGMLVFDPIGWDKIFGDWLDLSNI